MVGGKWCQPVYSQVVNPDHKYKYVDWENPEHECEDRVRIVEETRAFGQSLLSLVSRKSQRSNFMGHVPSLAHATVPLHTSLFAPCMQPCMRTDMGSQWPQVLAIC